MVADQMDVGLGNQPGEACEEGVRREHHGSCHRCGAS
jgi:hypothetical protein